MERLERRRSKRLDRERQALEQQVEAEFQQQLQQQQLVEVGEEVEPRTRRGSSSVYLPAGNDSLKVAKRVLQTIYALYQRYDRQHLIENASFAIAMVPIGVHYGVAYELMVVCCCEDGGDARCARQRVR